MQRLFEGDLQLGLLLGPGQWCQAGRVFLKFFDLVLKVDGRV